MTPRRHTTIEGGEAATKCGEQAEPEMVARGGVEPPTYRFSGGRSYRLSYLAVLGMSGPDGT